MAVKKDLKHCFTFSLNPFDLKPFFQTFLYIVNPSISISVQ